MHTPGRRFARRARHSWISRPPEIWRPITVDDYDKPSSIFALKQHFDKQWAFEFKEGLKAASKLAAIYTFDPENIAFDVRIIDAISEFKLPDKSDRHKNG